MAQRVGMEHLGPFSYQGSRFLLGAAALIPVVLLRRRSTAAAGAARRHERPGSARRSPGLLRDGLIAGLLLFAGSSLQQLGLQFTTAGNAGFITGFYVVLVPLLGVFLGHASSGRRWLGAGLALLGLYFLAVRGGLQPQRGDLLIVACAVFFALHVLLLARIAPRHSPAELALLQYLVTAVLSLALAGGLEELDFSRILRSWLPVAYGGLMSVGVAYSLQIVGQRRAHPTHAAIILSLEGVFAALGGWMLLGEVLTPRELLGAALLLGAMLVSQGIIRLPGRHPAARPQ